MSFHVREGEIVGLGGLMGAGRSETVRAIFGLDPTEKGSIKIESIPVKIKNVTSAIRSGLAMATEDRRRYGLVLCRSILENITYASLKQVSVFGFITKKKEKKLAEKYFDQLKIKAPNISTTVQFLSGGNQQKVVLSKWLASDAKILILDEPTRGVDVGAKYEIYQLMISLAEKGMGIIMISSELPEFIGMCDRAYIMYKGKIMGEFQKEEMTQEAIINLATGEID